MRDYNIGKESSAMYTIPKNEKNPPIDKNPGPGSYNIICKIADVPEYSIPNHKRNMEFKYVGK